MALEKQDSGVCLSATEPSSPAEASRPLAFFVDVGGRPAGPPKPTASSAESLPKARQSADTGAVGGDKAQRSATSRRTASGTPDRPRGEAVASTRKTSSELPNLSTKVGYCRQILI